jgi:hypothetical protein
VLVSAAAVDVGPAVVVSAAAAAVDVGPAVLVSAAAVDVGPAVLVSAAAVDVGPAVLVSAAAAVDGGGNELVLDPCDGGTNGKKPEIPLSSGRGAGVAKQASPVTTRFLLALKSPGYVYGPGSVPVGHARHVEQRKKRSFCAMLTRMQSLPSGDPCVRPRQCSVHAGLNRTQVAPVQLPLLGLCAAQK